MGGPDVPESSQIQPLTVLMPQLHASFRPGPATLQRKCPLPWAHFSLLSYLNSWRLLAASVPHPQLLKTTEQDQPVNCL